MLLRADFVQDDQSLTPRRGGISSWKSRSYMARLGLLAKIAADVFPKVIPLQMTADVDHRKYGKEC